MFADAIRSGRKRTTIRRWDRARVSAGQRVFCPGLGYLRVEAIEPVEWNELSEADAVADGFGTLREMKKVLLSLYPGKSDGKQWWRVSFVFNGPANPKDETRSSNQIRSSKNE